ncbi:MAG: oxygenase MpaB family protein [Chloroflexota bacterium]|nr:oxygenase MpaB family protein [Chloroflexota bacterium]MDE2941379.1 oxygenase MpaB family protein [Chloroflexota bacterium]MDE3267478.1 oxygenase MpaB family protein [Chloroflexota bacterium]
MQVPNDYVPGYNAAREQDSARADNYVEHTLIGDPEADAVMDELWRVAPRTYYDLIQACMDGDEEGMRDAPPLLREFFERLETPPAWVDHSAFTPGVRMFHRNSNLILAAFVGGTLVEGFATNIAKSFFITGRVRDRGVRRLRQNNRHLIEIFMPGGLDRSGDGWKLSVRIRLIHAQIRRLLNESSEWDTEAWGVPISAAHVGFAITAFSARLLIHMKRLGAVFNEAESRSFMDVWRYTGYLMGIPETILFRDEEDALELFRIGLICEPSPEFESIGMANALINSAPLIIDIDDPKERRSLASYVFRASRALIGDEMADSLEYPHSSSTGFLRLFRLQQRYYRLKARLLPRRSSDSNFTRFTSLLQASAFDEAGISYRLPDHVYAEESSNW